jgi:hypothetical protein
MRAHENTRQLDRVPKANCGPIQFSRPQAHGRYRGGRTPFAKNGNQAASRLGSAILLAGVVGRRGATRRAGAARGPGQAGHSNPAQLEHRRRKRELNETSHRFNLGYYTGDRQMAIGCPVASMIVTRSKVSPNLLHLPARPLSSPTTGGASMIFDTRGRDRRHIPMRKTTGLWCLVPRRLAGPTANPWNITPTRLTP